MGTMSFYGHNVFKGYNVHFRLIPYCILLEGLVQLPDTASYRTVQVFQLIPFTYQLEYLCLNAAILKYDSSFLSGCLLADLCSTLFLPHFHPKSCQV